MNSIVRSQCRLPRELNDRLTERARYESRSKNAQLIVERRERRAEMTESGACTRYRRRLWMQLSGQQC